MRVIATAGHVDHGKSTLVRALTGINPDRLAEEQARQMTIDLGFAWLPLPNGDMLGIVDVPGHEDFIENMLAGVGGIDLGLLIIAADEGVMPQTREHLAILDLLEIPQLVVALTKVDMVDDPDWVELVTLDIAETLESTHFTNIPIVPVSAVKNEGIDELLNVILNELKHLPPRVENGMPRLPIDRVFTIKGFGTVLTGTLLDGELQVGDTVEISPQGIEARIRGLQSHEEAIETALPGSRVAVNLANINTDAIQRGDVLTLPNAIHPTSLIDVALELLPSAPRPLKHNAEVKIFIGPSEAIGRVRLLQDAILLPGEQAWTQIQLDANLALVRGQRFIIRFPSPPATIGGGLILDTAPGRKWKRQQPDVYARFKRLAQGSPLDMISETLIQARRPLTTAEIMNRTNLSLDILTEMPATDDFITQADWVLHQETLAWLAERATTHLQRFHREHPLQMGMSLKQLAQALRLEGNAATFVINLLVEDDIIQITQNFAHLVDFSVQYSKAQQAGIAQLEEVFADNPYTPPSVKEAIEILGGDSNLLKTLVEQGELVQLGTDVLLTPSVYQEWGQFVYDYLQAHDSLRLAELRDQFQTSRKYALAFLDHLANLKLTRRVDEAHQLGRADWTEKGFNVA